MLVFFFLYIYNKSQLLSQLLSTKSAAPEVEQFVSFSAIKVCDQSRVVQYEPRGSLFVYLLVCSSVFNVLSVGGL